MLLIVVFTKIFKKWIYQKKITSFHLIQLILAEKDIVNSKKISSFQKECRMFISLVEKLFERMLNGILILKNVAIINPQKALEFGQQKYFSSIHPILSLYIHCINSCCRQYSPGV